MKNFNQYMEALLLAVKPQSDSVGQVSPCDAGVEPEMPKDMMSAAADDVLRNLGIQTDDGVGEMGEIQSDGEMTEGEEGEEGGVSLECLGEEGLRVNFNGMQIVLPRNVVDMIKGFEPSEGEGEEGETDENEQSEGEEGEENESEESESAESSESEESEDEEDDEKEESPFGEAFKPFVKGGKKGKKDECECKKGKGKTKGKGKFDFSQLKKKG